MSVDTPPPAAPTPEGPLPPQPPPPSPRATWAEKLAAVLFCIFCYEVGLFLIVYPWLDSWGRNYWFWLQPEWRAFLVSDSFRGAVTGLGVLNILVGFRETFRLRHLR